MMPNGIDFSFLYLFVSRICKGDLRSSSHQDLAQIKAWARTLCCRTDLSKLGASDSGLAPAKRLATPIAKHLASMCPEPKRCSSLGMRTLLGTSGRPGTSSSSCLGTSSQICGQHHMLANTPGCMMHRIALGCAALHCTALRDALHCVALHCTAVHETSHCIALLCTACCMANGVTGGLTEPHNFTKAMLGERSLSMQPNMVI